MNSGLMTFFFLVVGLEARREFDMGELRERQPARAAAAGRAGRDDRPDRDLPGLQRRPPDGARLGHGDVHRHRVRARHAGPGRLGPARPGAHLPAHVLGRRRRGRHRGHRGRLQRPGATAAAGRRAWLLLGRSARGRGAAASGSAPLYLLLGAGGLDRVLRSPAWTRSWSAWSWACSATPTRPPAPTWSGPPTCSGCSASSPPRSWPGPRREGVRAAISPNERLQQIYHPWTSYLIVPLFALANAGVVISAAASWPRPSPRRSRWAS